MIKALLIGVVIWLVLAFAVLAFMAGASFLNERYDSESKYNENYHEGE